MTVTEQDHLRFRWMARQVKCWYFQMGLIFLEWYDKEWVEQETYVEIVKKGDKMGNIDIDNVASLRKVIDAAIKKYNSKIV
jgi:hypothetical protein